MGCLALPWHLPTSHYCLRTRVVAFCLRWRLFVLVPGIGRAKSVLSTRPCYTRPPGVTQVPLVLHKAPWCYTRPPGVTQGPLVLHKAP